MLGIAFMENTRGGTQNRKFYVFMGFSFSSRIHDCQMTSFAPSTSRGKMNIG